MKYLSYEDTNLLVSAVDILHSEISLPTLAKRTLEAVNKIVSTDVTSFDNFSPNGREYFQNSWRDLNEELMPEWALEATALYMPENPVAVQVIVNKNIQPVKISDYITLRQFQRTNIYNELYKHFEVNYQLAFAIPVFDETVLTCSCTRWLKDFSERDRLLLSLIAPHLKNAIQNAHFAARLDNEKNRLQIAVEAKAIGLIALDENWKIIYTSEATENMLKKYFTGDKLKSNLLPEILNNWAKQKNEANTKEFNLPPAPFKIKNESGELTVRLIKSGATRETTLLLEEKKTPCPKMLEQLKISRREAEILFYIAQGKTDGEIGKILFISPRTVHKHGENIYLKLGVETRTAAMLKALEVFK